MTHMITRCPACGTSFRITEAQLNTAKGAVRCGSCLQIFRALDNQVTEKEYKQTTSEAAPSDQHPAETSAPHTPSFQFQISDQPQPLPEAKSTGTNNAGADGAGNTDSSAARKAPSVSATALKNAQAAQTDADEFHVDDDILISDEMPLDDGEEEKQPLFDDMLSDNFLELGGWKPSPKSLFEREPKVPEDDDERTDDPDESWAISLLEDEHHDAGAKSQSADKAVNSPKKTVPNTKPAPTRADAPEPNLDTDWNDGHEEPSFGSAIDEFDELFDGEGENLVRERRNLLSGIQPEPVEFAAYHGRNWRKILLWGGLSLLGLLLLIGQIGWFQFDHLSRHQPYRSVYTAICPLLKCQVPSLAAPELIRTSNLVIRSHPQAEGALVMDIILLNTASFQQPFPDLTLTFSNLHGEAVANRRFQPAEYLAGELAGRQLMPSNQPIHLTLEIVDPGPDAVSYSAVIPH